MSRDTGGTLNTIVVRGTICTAHYRSGRVHIRCARQLRCWYTRRYTRQAARAGRDEPAGRPPTGARDTINSTKFSSTSIYTIVYVIRRLRRSDATAVAAAALAASSTRTRSCCRQGSERCVRERAIEASSSEPAIARLGGAVTLGYSQLRQYVRPWRAAYTGRVTRVSDRDRRSRGASAGLMAGIDC